MCSEDNVSIAKTLLDVSRILNIVLGILTGIVLIVSIISIVGLIAVPVMAVFLVAILYVNKKLKEAVSLIERGMYSEARNKLIIPTIIEIIFISRITGVLMLIALILLPSTGQEQFAKQHYLQTY